MALLENLKTQAPWLFTEKHCTVIQSTYDARAFGNSDILFRCGSSALRFRSDRGQVFAEMSPPDEPGTWHDIVYLIEAIGGSVPAPVFDVGGVALLLKKHFEELVKALCEHWPKTKAALELRAQIRREELLSRFSPPKRH